MSPSRKPACARCGKTDLVGPAPLRTSAHPNSSFLMLETPGAHYHDFTVQGTACLACGAVALSLSAPTLERLRETVRPAPARGVKRTARKKR